MVIKYNFFTESSVFIFVFLNLIENETHFGIKEERSPTEIYTGVLYRPMYKNILFHGFGDLSVFEGSCD